MDDMKHRRLQELDRSDFEIVDGEPDIRGWDVKNSAGLKIGEVDELIVDAQQKKVRYMVVDLDGKDLKLPGRKVLLPIGLAELHDSDDDVILPTVTVDQLSVLPAYDRENLDEEVEQKVCTALGRSHDSVNTMLQTGSATPQATHTARQAETESEKMESPAMQPVSQSSQAGDAATPAHTGQPPIGTAEYYGNFYQHAFFNEYNLYRHRQQQTEASNTGSESDYERGLRLWEMRYEDNEETGNNTERKHRDRKMSDDTRMELARNRRKSYEERKRHDSEDRYRAEDRLHNEQNDHAHRKDNTIIGRIRDEGMQDA